MIFTFTPASRRALRPGWFREPSSHAPRPPGSIAHLGFLPDLPYDAVEVVGAIDPDIARRWPVVRFSDAHHPDQLARRFIPTSRGPRTA